MKVYMKPIEMIAHSTANGDIKPIRFKWIRDDKSETVVKIDKVLGIEQEKLAGNVMYIFKCTALEKVFELKYEIKTCKWFLFKM